MKATYDGPYMKPAPEGSPAGTPGRMVFRYKVSGTKDELKAYKQAQGGDGPKSNYRETDDGKKTPLWFTVNVLPKQVTLGISRNSGKVFADNSELQRLQLLSEQYPNLAPEINKQMGAILFAKATVSAPAEVSAVKAGVDQE